MTRLIPKTSQAFVFRGFEAIALTRPIFCTSRVVSLLHHF